MVLLILEERSISRPHTAPEYVAGRYGVLPYQKNFTNQIPARQRRPCAAGKSVGVHASACQADAKGNKLKHELQPARFRLPN